MAWMAWMVQVRVGAATRDGVDDGVDIHAIAW
jgi:hypothetical protein